MAGNRDLADLIDTAGVSHASLARQVVALGRSEYGLHLRYDYRSVGRWLRGAVPEPPAPVLIARALSTTLRREVHPDQLGFQERERNRRSLVISSDPRISVAAVTDLWRAAVDRRRFLSSGAAFTASFAVEAALDQCDAHAEPVTARSGGVQLVTDADVERVRGTGELLRDLDHANGGGHALEWLEQYLDEEVAPLLNGRYTARTGRELFLTTALLTDMGGWMAMDAGFQSLGQRMFTQSSALAGHAGASALSAASMANLATLALLVGEVSACVRLARSAVVTGGRALPETLRARILLVEARGHALKGDRTATYAVLNRATRAMDRSDPSHDPDWLGVTTTAHLEGQIMHTLRDLGELAEAGAHYAGAMRLPAKNVRTAALHEILYAGVLADQGEPDGAVEHADVARRHAYGLRSARLGRRLDEFAALISAHRVVPCVADYLEVDRARRVVPSGVQPRDGKRR